MRRVRMVSLLALMVVGAVEGAAQCPDGFSQPPCPSARRPVARRPDPPLDDRTWIVVPFNNVTRSQDVDYLRDASVNLLYLDMSRWSDIRVVDDARVADLLKEVPEARTMPLSLEAATAVARRAGAGRMVMGNIIKQGARTTLAAKVFDVRRGSVIRSPQQDLIVQDSLMSVFGKLAGAILNVAPPAGTNIADVGTTRVDAYQEYLLGAAALKKFDLATARARLTQALKLDSTFSLAHYRMSILIGWDNSADSMKRVHAAQAVRFGTGLPARERTLMKGLNEFEEARYAVSCATYSSLIKADSSDVEALYGIGECTFHDLVVVAAADDTSKRVFRANWNTAMRVFERVVELDPSYHLAYQHILDVLTTERRSGFDRATCPLLAPTQPRCNLISLVRRQGDTLITMPVTFQDTAGLRMQQEDATRSGARRRNLELARDKARVWVSAAPDENRSHIQLAYTSYLIGDYATADAQLAQVSGQMTGSEVARVIPARIEIAIKLGRGESARRLVDSVLTVPSIAAGARVFAFGFGRATPFDSAIRANLSRAGPSGPPPPVRDYVFASLRAAVVGGSPRVDSAERALLTLVASATPLPMPPSITQMTSYVYAPRLSRTWAPFAYTADPRASALVALSKGDTTRLRAEIRVIDSTLRARPITTPDSAAGLLLAELQLALRDSAGALRTVRRMLDTTMLSTPVSITPLYGQVGMPAIVVWPRLSLLRADLELAAGNKSAAREWYKRFVDLWTGADPEFQPIVQRAQKALAALGPP